MQNYCKHLSMSLASENLLFLLCRKSERERTPHNDSKEGPFFCLLAWRRGIGRWRTKDLRLANSYMTFATWTVIRWTGNKAAQALVLLLEQGPDIPNKPISRPLLDEQRQTNSSRPSSASDLWHRWKWSMESWKNISFSKMVMYQSAPKLFLKIDFSARNKEQSSQELKTFRPCSPRSGPIGPL